MVEVRESLFRRYGSRLMGGGITIPVNTLAQAVANRHLGPAGLGIYSFTVGIFGEICAFIDGGLGLAHYRKLCAEPANGAWTIIFTRVLLALCGLFAIGLLLSIGFGWGELFWGEIPTSKILLGAGIALATWLVSLAGKSSDAHALTSRTEVSRVCVRVLLLLALIGVAAAGWLNLLSYYWLQLTALLLLAVIWGWQVHRAGHRVASFGPVTNEELRREGRYLVSFVSPLMAYSAVGLVSGLFDRWLLLASAGEVQQGYFAVGLQLAAFCFVFTSALTQLLIGEYTRAVAQQDRKRLRSLFRDSVGGLYVVACFMGFFCAANVDGVLALYAGEEFLPGRMAVAILCLYPLHQTYGQLSGSLLLAAGDSKRFSWIGIFTSVCGIPLTFLLVSGQGANLGATGLALKLVLVQVLLVNIQLYFNARYLELSFPSLFAQQTGIAVCFAGPAFGAAWIARALLGPGAEALYLSVALFTISTTALVWHFDLGGLREHLKKFAGSLFHRLYRWFP